MRDEEFCKIVKDFIERFPDNLDTLLEATGAPRPAVQRWAEGISSPYSFMQPLVIKFIETCTCPTECDCSDPPPDDERESKKGGAYGVSNECPIHNDNPKYSSDCPVHKKYVEH